MASQTVLTDHDEIRRWAEERRAQPACVKGTGGRRGRGDVGMIRLDFPGFSGGESLASISWDDWFRQFDENGLALIVQERTRGGQTSNFNKLVKRETAQERGSRSRKNAAPRQASRGRTTTSRTLVSRKSRPSGKGTSPERVSSRGGAARGARSR